jgi:hypothetical protein
MAWHALLYSTDLGFMCGKYCKYRGGNLLDLKKGGQDDHVQYKSCSKSTVSMPLGIQNKCKTPITDQFLICTI